MLEGAVSDFEWWWWFDQSDIKWRACVVTVRRLNRYEVIQIRRLSSIVIERDDFVFNSFRNLKPAKRLLALKTVRCRRRSICHWTLAY